MTDQHKAAELVHTLRQSPRSATVTDIEDVCDYVLQLEAERDEWKLRAEHSVSLRQQNSGHFYPERPHCDYAGPCEYKGATLQPPSAKIAELETERDQYKADAERFVWLMNSSYRPGGYFIGKDCESVDQWRTFIDEQRNANP